MIGKVKMIYDMKSLNISLHWTNYFKV